MAINIPILTEFQDNGIRAAKKAFENFQSAVGDAQGGLGKFKAGSSAIFDAVKANAGAMALGGGAAIAAFALKGVADFQNLALAADEFEGKTGLTVEQASRWKEVAGDINIEQGALETTLGKMNRTIGDNPDLFRDLGIDLEYAKDGSLDVNATFLNTIQHLKDIKDPAERAKEGVKLLGKNWQATANLIQLGAGPLEKALADVSDQQVIDESEVAKAKEFRDRMDELKDSVGKVALELGETLIPVLAEAAGFIADVMEPLIAFSDWVHKDDIMPKVQEIIQAFEDQYQAAKDSKDEIALYGRAAQTASYQAEELNLQVQAQARFAEDADLKWQALKGTLNLNQAVSNAEAELTRLAEAAGKAMGGSEEDVKKFNTELDTAKQKVIALADQVTLSSKNQAKIQIMVEKGQLQDAIDLIERIGNAANGGLIGKQKARELGAGFAPRAAGGPVVGGSTYLVGERGPELFTPSSSGNITPNGAIGGANITVNVNGGDPNSIVRALQQYVRQSGPVPVNTRAM